MAEKPIGDMTKAEVQAIDYEASALEAMQNADRFSHSKPDVTLQLAAAQVWATLALVRETQHQRLSIGVDLVKVWQALEDNAQALRDLGYRLGES